MTVPQWDITEPLDGAPSNRRIGVVVGSPFHHHGHRSTYVDIERETVSVNTRSWGNCYPVADTQERAGEALTATIAELDGVIRHLTAHRDRLVAERESLPARVFASDPVSDHPAPPVVDVPLPLGGVS